jgi:hypothetical protein
VIGDGIDVRGGVGGIGVGLDEVEAAAHLLLGASGDLAAGAARLAAAGADPHVLASLVISPLTGARAEAALARAAGPAGLTGQSVALGALGAATVDAVVAYREGERAVTRLTAAAQEAVMVLVGAAAPAVAVGALTLEALGVDVREDLDRVAFDHPVVSDLGGRTAGLVMGASTNALTAPVVLGVESQRLLPRRGLDGGPVDPDSGAVGVLADAAGVVGLLHDGGPARVVAEPRPRPGARAPQGVAALARDLGNLSDGDEYPAHVRVVEVPREHGSAWLVEVAGTQVWDPHGGDNPFDVTSDVHLMAQESTVLGAGVEQALAQAQAATGRDASSEPVMLAGHSLGGIVAAALASSPRFRAAHHVTHVVTLGSPVARLPVPEQVHVLSVEHAQDPVPRLDGRANPDRAGWVTVTRDLRGDATQPGRASAAHSSDGYAETGAAVDASTDRSVRDWRAGSREFFHPTGGRVAVVRDFRIGREGVAAPAAAPTGSDVAPSGRKP